MSIYVPFNGKKRKIRYSNTTARNISLLYSFFKKFPDKYKSTRDIREYVNVSNTLLWQLAYQKYLTVSIRRFKRTDGMCVQSFRWKANIDRFQEFMKESKLQEEKLKLREQKHKEYLSTNLIETLQTGPEVEDESEDI